MLLCGEVVIWPVPSKTHSFSRHLTRRPSENYFTKCFLSILPDNDSSLLSIAGCQRFQPIWVCFKIWRPLKHPTDIATCFIRIWNEAEFDVETAGNVGGWTFDTGDEWFCGFRRDELLGLVSMQAFSNGAVFFFIYKRHQLKRSPKKKSVPIWPFFCLNGLTLNTIFIYFYSLSFFFRGVISAVQGGDLEPNVPCQWYPWGPCRAPRSCFQCHEQSTSTGTGRTGRGSTTTLGCRKGWPWQTVATTCASARLQSGKSQDLGNGRTYHRILQDLYWSIS